MKLKEKINNIRKARAENGSNDKIYLLNKLMAENQILIVPKNVSRKIIEEGVRENIILPTCWTKRLVMLVSPRAS